MMNAQNASDQTGGQLPLFSQEDFPCQPYSAAGKRKGKDDERHLWPQMLRTIREISPRYIVGENVRGLVNWSGGLVFEEVQTDLELAGYEVMPFLLPACAVDAPHRRDRIFFIAHAINSRYNPRRQFIAPTYSVQDIFGGLESAGLHRITTNANGKRSGQKQAHIRNGGKRGKSNDVGQGSSNGIIADPDSAGLQEEGTQQQATRSEQYGELVDGGNASDPNGSRWLQGIPGHASGITNEESQEAISANTDSELRRVGGLHQTSPGISARHARAFDASRNGWQSWNDFPTQSPLCSRNDGLSAKLDGITFSNHRRESVKAYGNAVVPQVIFQIFRALQAYDDLYETIKI
jgi:DNA (cytosine-5)-methyltransferase 1